MSSANLRPPEPLVPMVPLECESVGSDRRDVERRSWPSLLVIGSNFHILLSRMYERLWPMPQRSLHLCNNASHRTHEDRYHTERVPFVSLSLHDHNIVSPLLSSIEWLLLHLNIFNEITFVASFLMDAQYFDFCKDHSTFSPLLFHLTLLLHLLEKVTKSTACCSRAWVCGPVDGKAGRIESKIPSEQVKAKTALQM